MMVSPALPGVNRRNSAGKTSICKGVWQEGHGVKSGRLKTLLSRVALHFVQQTNGEFMRTTVLFIDHARIANAVVQGAFLVIKSSHDVADVTNQPAENFCEVASGGATVADLRAVGVHHFEFAEHFAGSGAEFANKENRIKQIGHVIAELQENLNGIKSV